jgi:hypothetical protein
VKKAVSVAVALALASAGIAAGDANYSLEERRSIAEPTAPTKHILVVAIADDPQIRNRFEDKFVSHLRGRGIMATASHPSCRN